MPSLGSVSEDARHRYRAPLRVSSRTLGIAELSQALGSPTGSHDAGDPVTRRRPDAPKRKEALWLRESGLDEAVPLDQHIAALLDVIDARHDDFKAIRERCEIDIFCGVFSGEGQGGFALDPDVSRRLADADLAVVFDIY